MSLTLPARRSLRDGPSPRSRSADLKLAICRQSPLCFFEFADQPLMLFVKGDVQVPAIHLPECLGGRMSASSSFVWAVHSWIYGRGFAPMIERNDAEQGEANRRNSRKTDVRRRSAFFECDSKTGEARTRHSMQRFTRFYISFLIYSQGPKVRRCVTGCGLSRCIPTPSGIGLPKMSPCPG
jgi:hypothetical protein